MLTPAMAAQLLSGEVLPAGAQNITARQAPSGNWEIFVNGAPMCSGLTKAQALRCAALLREGFKEGWTW
jgi:hypothetical protein